MVFAEQLEYITSANTVLQLMGKIKHMLTNLSWFLYHPKKNVFGKPITVWYNNLFEPCGVHTIVPVQLVKCRLVSVVDKLDHEDVFIVIPCIDF